MNSAPTPAMMAGPKKERVAVFFDYENVHRTAHNLYTSPGTPTHSTAFNPIKLAEKITAKRNRASTLANVRVYRGRPVPAHQPTPASAFDLQQHAWKSDARVVMRTRDLRYRFDDADPTIFQAQEKGIDVSLAIDLVEAAMNETYDALIVFSCDTDLLPALELVKKIHKTHMEIACWNGANPLWLREGLALDPPQHFPFCHFLNDQDFTACKETVASGL